MSHRKILITGMGGDIGTGVALRLDTDTNVRMLGIDIEPPRRRLLRADFHRVDPEDIDTRVELIRDFDPHVIVHLGIYEPHSRSNPVAATRRTRATTKSVFRAARECPSLQKVVMRSGVDVYGRSHGRPLRPDEAASVAPTSRFGRSLAEAERMALAFGHEAEVPVTILRFAAIVGPYIPSPLGRYLRLPVVPFSAPIDGPIQLVHIDDVHDAFAAAVRSEASGVFNIVGEGAVSGSQAARLGGRLPLPVMGPFWFFARALTATLGSPLPEHSMEALRWGQTADGSRARRELDFVPERSTRECIEDLYEWASVVHLPVRREDVA